MTLLLSGGITGVSRMPSNESVIPSVSVSAITKLNGKIGIVCYKLLVVGCTVILVYFEPPGGSIMFCYICMHNPCILKFS